MGRSRGGYSGGSTITTPGQWSARSDEGPPAALERARLENDRIRSESAVREAEHKLSCEEADKKIDSANQATDEFRCFVKSLLQCWLDDFDNKPLEDEYLKRLSSFKNYIDTFVLVELPKILILGPKYKRIGREIEVISSRLNNAHNSYSHMSRRRVGRRKINIYVALSYAGWV